VHKRDSTPAGACSTELGGAAKGEGRQSSVVVEGARGLTKKPEKLSEATLADYVSATEDPSVKSARKAERDAPADGSRVETAEKGAQGLPAHIMEEIVTPLGQPLEKLWNPLETSGRNWKPWDQLMAEMEERNALSEKTKAGITAVMETELATGALGEGGPGKMEEPDKATKPLRGPGMPTVSGARGIWQRQGERRKHLHQVKAGRLSYLTRCSKDRCILLVESACVLGTLPLQGS
jgi:hypothetical protein